MSRARSKRARTFTSARWTRGMRARARRGGARGRSRSRRRCDSRRSPRGDVVFLVGRGTRGRTCLEMRRLVSFAAGAARAERAMQAMVATDVPGVFLAERGGGMPARTATGATWHGGYRIPRSHQRGKRAPVSLTSRSKHRTRGASRLAPRASPHTTSRAHHGAHHRALRRGVPGGAHRWHPPHRRLPQVRRQQRPGALSALRPDPTRRRARNVPNQILPAPHAPSIPRPLTRPLPPPLPPSPPASSPAR